MGLLFDLIQHLWGPNLGAGAACAVLAAHHTFKALPKPLAVLLLKSGHNLSGIQKMKDGKVVKPDFESMLDTDEKIIQLRCESRLAKKIFGEGPHDITSRNLNAMKAALYTASAIGWFRSVS